MQNLVYICINENLRLYIRKSRENQYQFLKKKKKSKLMIEKHTDLSTLVKFYRLYIGKNN